MNKQEKKMITPNKFDVVLKQMKDVLGGNRIPNEIPENEKAYYHVLIVESTPNQKTLQYDHKVKTQIFNDRSWVNVEKQLKQLGYSNIHILHDPSLLSEEDLKIDKVGVVDRKELIKEARELGYDGALNVKNEVFSDFIKNAMNPEGSEE